jgi:hypothetical protein
MGRERFAAKAPAMTTAEQNTKINVLRIGHQK